MSKIREFEAAFGLDYPMEVEMARFVTRIEEGFFNVIETELLWEDLIPLFKNVCLHLGMNSHWLLERHREGNPLFALISESDYIGTLKAVVAINDCMDDGPGRFAYSARILDIIKWSSPKLGIRWLPAEGVFVPVGDEILDEELIGTALKNVDLYPNEHKDLKIALQNYQAGNLYGVVDNCYKALEGLARHLLGNTRNLDNNKSELLQFFSLTREWGVILGAHINYANEYHRHASEKRHDLKVADVEAFLYLTCLMVRMAIRSHNEKTTR